MPYFAVIGFDPEEDARRHTVSDGGVVVVTVGDEPLVAPIPAAALARERDADGRT